jgi:hypothetical protein
MRGAQRCGPKITAFRRNCEQYCPFMDYFLAYCKTNTWRFAQTCGFVAPTASDGDPEYSASAHYGGSPSWRL